MTPPVVGLVLAAGASRRAGCVKGLAELEGRPLVEVICDTLLAGGCARVLVVIGPPHHAALANALGGRHEPVENPAPELGMFHSLQLGVSAAGDASAVVVALVDHPRVQASTVAKLLAIHAEDRGVVLHPTYQGRRGHPFLIGRSAFQALSQAEPTMITRDMLLRLGERIDIEVDDPGVIDDLDTRAALEEVGARIPSASG